MVEVLGFLLGIPFIYLGWVYYTDPQRAFRLDNWPFALKGTEGVTDEGKSTYRIRGGFLMVMGLLLVVFELLG